MAVVSYRNDGAPEECKLSGCRCNHPGGTHVLYQGLEGNVASTCAFLSVARNQ